VAVLVPAFIMVANAVAVAPTWIERLDGSTADNSRLVLVGSTKRPMLFAVDSVNQRLPSDPKAIPTGWLPCVGIENCVTAPVVVTRKTALDTYWVNHNAPSGPTVMPGPRLGSGIRLSRQKW
jgi:hypothetical protein